MDNNADGLVDELHADFEDEAWDGGVVFTTTQLGIPLLPGTYLNTERYGNTSPGHPGFVLRIESTIPGQSYGSFTVVALEIDYSGAAPVLVRASITFDMDPLGHEMHLHGVFNYNYAPAG